MIVRNNVSALNDAGRCSEKCNDEKYQSARVLFIVMLMLQSLGESIKT